MRLWVILALCAGVVGVVVGLIFWLALHFWSGAFLALVCGLLIITTWQYRKGLKMERGE